MKEAGRPLLNSSMEACAERLPGGKGGATSSFTVAYATQEESMIERQSAQFWSDLSSFYSAKLTIDGLGTGLAGGGLIGFGGGGGLARRCMGSSVASGRAGGGLIGFGGGLASL